MKRIAWISAVVLLAVVALFALLALLVPRQTLKTRIGEQIAAWTGREVSLRGEPEIDFFPELTVTLKDVVVGGPGGMADAEIVSMDRLKGSIRLLPLVIGRVEVGSFTLVRPLVHLVRDKEGDRNWAFESGAAALQLAFAGDVPLGDFVLEDGTLVYENRQREITERLDSINLSVAWPSVRQPLAATGSGIWRGEQVAFSAGAEEPFRFLNGEATPFQAKIDSAPIAVNFGGTAIDANAPQFSGNLSMSTPSLRGFASWLGSPIGPGSTLGQASLSGAAHFRENVLSVENAQLALDGNNADGALKVTLAKQPEVSGTLAFGTLNLDPYLTGYSGSLAAGGDWRALRLGTGWFHDLAADIRLSAASVQAGQFAFGDTAATVSLRDARLEMGLAGAAFLGGTLAGDIAVTGAAKASDPTMEAQLRATDFDLAQATQALGLARSLAGTASASIDAESRGETFGALLREVNGVGKLDVAGGGFPLFGIAEIAVAGAGANPQQTGVAQVTPVKNLSIGFSFGRGVAVLERGSVSALSFTADAKGWVGMLDGSLGLNGTVHPDRMVAAGAPPVPFTIAGTLAQPQPRPLALAN